MVKETIMEQITVGKNVGPTVCNLLSTTGLPMTRRQKGECLTKSDRQGIADGIPTS